MTLTEADVLNWVGAAQVKKAKGYLNALSELYLQGGALRAEVQGSDVHPYRVRAELGPGGVEHAHCSCPVGGPGRCKHVAAVLLRFVRSPDAFSPRPSLQEALGSWSQARLVQLVQQMVSLHPELESLVFARQTGGSEAQGNLRGLFAVIRRNHDPWDEQGPDDSLIWQEVERADAQLFDPATARRALDVYETVLDEIETSYRQWDTDGVLDDLLHHCLGRCLEFVAAGVEHEQARQDALEIVRSAYASRLAYPYLDDVRPLLGALSQPEREDFRELFQGLLQGRGYGKTYYAAALLQLTPEQELDAAERERLLLAANDPAAILGFYLEAGRDEDVRRFAARPGRHDLTGPDLTGLDAVFARYGRQDLQEELIQGAYRAGARWPGSREREWLYRRFLATGRTARAHELAREATLAHAEPEWYGRTRETSERWEQERPVIMRALRQDGRLTERLLGLYLLEGLLEEAEQLYRDRRRSVGQAAALRLAEQLQHRPAAAAVIYAEQAERLIEQQGRERYREAAQLLRRVRDLQGTDEWDSLLAALLTRHKRLRALPEELAKVGLL